MTIFGMDNSNRLFWKFECLRNVDKESFKESSVARAVPHAARTLDGKAPRRSYGSAGRKTFSENSVHFGDLFSGSYSSEAATEVSVSRSCIANGCGL